MNDDFYELLWKLYKILLSNSKSAQRMVFDKTDKRSHTFRLKWINLGTTRILHYSVIVQTIFYEITTSLIDHHIDRVCVIHATCIIIICILLEFELLKSVLKSLIGFTFKSSYWNRHTLNQERWINRNERSMDGICL